jgi:hypothetical protein
VDIHEALYPNASATKASIVAERWQVKLHFAGIFDTWIWMTSITSLISIFESIGLLGEVT